MNIMHSCGLIEIKDRSVALFDIHSPLRAIAYSPIAGDDIIPALRAVLQSAASKHGGNDFSFLRGYSEICIYTNYAGRSIHSRIGQRFGLITSSTLEAQARNVLSFLGISHDLLCIIPEGTSLASAPIRKTINEFLYLGAKSVAVCLDLDGSSRIREEELRNIVYSFYPSHFLGSVPVLLPSERLWQGEERLESVVVNGYVRAGLARQFRDIMNTLRQYGFSGRLTSYGVNGQFIPVSQCDAWNLIAYEFSRFESLLKQWIEEEAVVEGLALHLGFDDFEIAIIGNCRIKTNGCSLRNRIPMPVVWPSGALEEGRFDGLGRGEQDDENKWNRQWKQWVNQLAFEVRKRAGADGLQLLSNTQLFLCGPAGGLVGCELADALGIKAFRLTGYETECRVPPGWTIQHHLSTHTAFLGRLR